MADKQVLANIIDGEERPAASGDVLDIINPSTGEVYATAPNSGTEDVDAAFRLPLPRSRATGGRHRASDNASCSSSPTSSRPTLKNWCGSSPRTPASHSQ